MRLTTVRLFGLVVFVSTLAFLITSAWSQMMGHERMTGMQGKEGMERGMGMGMSGYRGGYGGGPFDIDMLKDQLKLNDDQMAKLKKIRSDYQKEMIKRHANMKVAEMELWEILDTKNLDMAKAEKKVKELEGMRSDLMMYRIKALQDTQKFLTPEQYEQFRELGFRAMRGMMGRHGMGGGMMGGGMGGGMMGPMGGGMPDDDDD